LVFAAENGHAAVVTCLVDRSAEVNVYDEVSEPLADAIRGVPFTVEAVRS
jgi:hypothetical protein